MKIYISTAVNSLARLDSKTSPDDVVGLGTQNLNTCVAVFIFNAQKISLIHVSFQTDLQSLLSEVSEIGNNCQITVVYSNLRSSSSKDWVKAKGGNIKGDEVFSETMEFLKTHLSQITPKVVDSPTGRAYLDRKGMLILDPAFLKGFAIQYSPQMRLRNAIRHLNAILSLKQKVKPTLEFDGCAFGAMDALSEQSKVVVGSIRPYLREKELPENNENIANYLQEVIINKAKTETEKFSLTTVANVAVNSLKVILDNSISRQYFNSRPCFFVGCDSVKVLYSTAANEEYARTRANIIAEIDSDDRSPANSQGPQLLDDPNKEEALIPQNDSNNNIFTLPKFWLRQLGAPAIDEIVKEFKLDTKTFIQSFK